MRSIQPTNNNQQPTPFPASHYPSMQLRRSASGLASSPIDSPLMPALVFGNKCIKALNMSSRTVASCRLQKIAALLEARPCWTRASGALPSTSHASRVSIFSNTSTQLALFPTPFSIAHLLWTILLQWLLPPITTAKSLSCQTVIRRLVMLTSSCTMGAPRVVKSDYTGSG